MKKALLGGVSSVTLSLIATAAFAFDGSGNIAGADNNIATGGSTQNSVAGGSTQYVGSLNQTLVATDSGNTSTDNSNVGNTGQIAGSDNNAYSNNTVDISGNASGNKSITVFDLDVTKLHIHSKNVDNSADFSDVSGYVSGNVLNAQ